MVYSDTETPIPVTSLKKGDCFGVGWQQYCIEKIWTENGLVHIRAIQMETEEEVYFIFEDDSVVAEYSWY
jgi:hypothetical protein